MREKLLRLGLVGLLAVPVGGAVACDREDVRDAEEAGNEVDNQIDKIDTDGKDD